MAKRPTYTTSLQHVHESREAEPQVRGEGHALFLDTQHDVEAGDPRYGVVGFVRVGADTWEALGRPDRLWLTLEEPPK